MKAGHCGVEDYLETILSRGAFAYMKKQWVR